MTRSRVEGLTVPFDWESRVRAMPSAARVAQLAESHGFEVARERWSWIQPRTLARLAWEGRVEKAKAA